MYTITEEVGEDRVPTIFVTLSDLHIGHQSLEQVTKEYYDEENGFFVKLAEVYDYCQENGIKFGGVGLTGDIFDHLLTMNSPLGKFAIDLIHAICAIVIRDYDGVVVVLRGTRGHDMNQLAMFEPFVYEFENRFFLINSVEEMSIWGYKFLIIPEEYMTNPTKYYGKYFAKKYDIIWGHGFFAWNCFSKNEVERPVPGMPIFDQRQIANIARVTVFGHDHIHKSYRDVIFYNGSYSRLCHGEEDEKGGLITYIDNDNVVVDRMINELAPKYLSVQLHKLVKGEMTYENAVKAIRKKAKEVDFLKVKVSKELVEENPTMIELINTTFASQYKKGIVIDSPSFALKDGKLLMFDTNKHSEENSEENVEKSIAEHGNSEYSYLLETETPMSEKVFKWIKQKHGDKIDVDVDTIKDILSAKS